jgi:hypothetical protein
VLSKVVVAGMHRLSLSWSEHREVRLTAYATTSCSSAEGSKARRMVAADFWMCSQDALIPAMACSPPPAHVATYPKE